jgi:uncharacterized protein YifN (PemK superfamily)
MKVGQIVECDFGMYRPDERGHHHVDGRVPPEMIKYRLAIVLNARLGRGCVVVPVSSRHDLRKEQRGYHVRLDPSCVPEVRYWKRRERWAKAELVQYVSVDRVFALRDDRLRQLKERLPDHLVAKIQRAVVRMVGGASLLRDPESDDAEIELLDDADERTASQFAKNDEDGE